MSSLHDVTDMVTIMWMASLAWCFPSGSEYVLSRHSFSHELTQRGEEIQFVHWLYGYLLGNPVACCLGHVFSGKMMAFVPSRAGELPNVTLPWKCAFYFYLPQMENKMFGSFHLSVVICQGFISCLTSIRSLKDHRSEIFPDLSLKKTC